jgi:hypothetical protein
MLFLGVVDVHGSFTVFPRGGYKKFINVNFEREKGEEEK